MNMTEQKNRYATEVNFIKAALADYLTLLNDRPAVQHALTNQINTDMNIIINALVGYDQLLNDSTELNKNGDG